MFKTFNVVKMSLATVAGLVLLTSGARAAADAACFQVVGSADASACHTAAELKDLGVVAVRFQPQTLQRTDSTTSWNLFGYKAGTPVVLQMNLVGVLSYVAETEDGVLGAQDELCAPLVAAGIACERDLIAGTWVTYQIPDGSPQFTAKFASNEATAMAATGSVVTKRFACHRGAEATGDLAQVEIECHANYLTSLRLLYLNNAASITFSDVNCFESGAVRAAQVGTASLPECRPADAPYAAEFWFPLGVQPLNYTVSTATRTYIQQAHVSLYRGAL